MKIALIGYGKMGKAIEQIAIQKGHQIVLRISSSNQDELSSEKIKDVDVAIEFSRPESAYKNVLFCLENDIPLVCGTTGWLQHLKEAEDLCLKRKGAFIYASNFSIGVNLFFELNKHLADLMKDRSEYDTDMEEIHHIHKRDSPSGTAITLARDIIGSGKKDSYAVTDHPDARTLGIKSIREGEVPGTHKIRYFSANDQIEIIHTAYDRTGFAAGAVAAAAYISNRRGIFTMKDVLGL